VVKPVRKVRNFNNDHDVLMLWARQTIGWALSLCAFENGQPIESPEHAADAHKLSYETAERLWRDTIKEVGSNLTPASVKLYYARNVMDWCQIQRRRK
jgi:hypothetical protein